MDARDPFVSVVMPVYNCERFLRETIASVLQQTYANFEFIIVNDGSTDATAQIIASYGDPRIICHNLPANRGVAGARNFGTSLARGEYLAFCDADDLYDPARLQVQVDFLRRHPHIDVCGSDFTVIGNGREQLVRNPRTDRRIKEYFLTGNCLGQPSMIGKTGVFRQYPYDPALQVSEDYDLWTRMAMGGVVFANVPQALVTYRLHSGQASSAKGDLLHLTSKAISSKYTLACLNNCLITEHVQAAALSRADFRRFIAELAGVCQNQNRDINTFRQLIALQYRKLNSLGLRSFLTFLRLNSQQRLVFPAKYLLNLFFLSILPVKNNSSLFETLTKLKLYVPRQEEEGS